MGAGKLESSKSVNRAPIAGDSLRWFSELRTLRDHIVHFGAAAVLHCDGRQFNLWAHSPKLGWITREPLLPLLAGALKEMVAFGDRSAHAINQLISFPRDRLRSRIVAQVPSWPLEIPAVMK